MDATSSTILLSAIFEKTGRYNGFNNEPLLFLVRIPRGDFKS